MGSMEATRLVTQSRFLRWQYERGHWYESLGTSAGSDCVMLLYVVVYSMYCVIEVERKLGAWPLAPFP